MGKNNTTLKAEIIKRIHQKLPPGQPRSYCELTRAQVAEYLHALRIWAGITRKELATITGIDAQIIARLENPEVAEDLSPAEIRLQDLLMQTLGAKPEPRRYPYRLPTEATQAREYLQRLKAFKKSDRIENLRANFITEDGRDLFDEV